MDSKDKTLYNKLEGGSRLVVEVEEVVGNKQSEEVEVEEEVEEDNRLEVVDNVTDVGMDYKVDELELDQLGNTS